MTKPIERLAAQRPDLNPVPVLAVIDGVGKYAEVHLYADDETEIECEWPVGWPHWVSKEFLEAHGCKVITA